MLLKFSLLHSKPLSDFWNLEPTTAMSLSIDCSKTYSMFDSLPLSIFILPPHGSKIPSAINTTAVFLLFRIHNIGSSPSLRK